MSTVRCRAPSCSPAAHLVVLQHLGSPGLVWDGQPDVGEGGGIVAQPQAHLHLHRLTDGACAGVRCRVRVELGVIYHNGSDGLQVCTWVGGGCGMAVGGRPPAVGTHQMQGRRPQYSSAHRCHRGSRASRRTRTPAPGIRRCHRKTLRGCRSLPEQGMGMGTGTEPGNLQPKLLFQEGSDMGENPGFLEPGLGNPQGWRPHSPPWHPAPCLPTYFLWHCGLGRWQRIQCLLLLHLPQRGLS